MIPIFGRGPSLVSRIVIAVVLSGVLMFVDHRLNGFDGARVYLNSLVSPLQYIASLPQNMLDWSAESLASRQRLLEENQSLKEQQLLLSEQMQRMAFLQRENNRLRALLNSPVRQDVSKMVAEVMSVESNANSHTVVVNKGSLSGLYEGQPVLDDQGIVGQVVSVGPTNSRVLLITDITHAIPLRIAKNSVRLIASGTGFINKLELNHVTHSTEIEVGDLLVSSGLGKLFPEGYPVAQVTKVTRNTSLPFARVQAKPIAKLDRIRYLLLLWPPNTDKQPIFETIEQLTEKAEGLLQ